MQEFNEELFLKTFDSLVQEYNAVPNPNGIENIILHFPKAWEKQKTLKIEGVHYDFTTEETLEIEVEWTPNFTALVMKAPA